MDEGHSFVWSRKFGPILFLRDGGMIKLEVINKVLNFPEPAIPGADDLGKLSRLRNAICNADAAEEEDLGSFQNELSQLRQDLREGVQTMDNETVAEFMKSSKGQALRKRVLQGVKRLRKSAVTKRLIEPPSTNRESTSNITTRDDQKTCSSNGQI